LKLRVEGSTGKTGSLNTVKERGSCEGGAFYNTEILVRIRADEETPARA
jgi:hypothetical protein